MAGKQRWYCGKCGARYMTKFGLLLEVRLQGMAYYLLAQLPPQHMGDLKNAIIQMRYSENCKTALDPYNCIPDLQPSSVKLSEPLDFGWAHKGVPLKGHFRILDMPHLLALPRFDWNVLYHTPKVLEHGVQGAVDRSIAEGGELRTVDPTYVPHVPNTVTLRSIDSSWT